MRYKAPVAEREEAIVGGEPEARWKPRVRIFVALFVILQLLVPLRYYLGDDPYDERFSWRMFSAVRVHRCRVNAAETIGGTPRAIDLNREIHRAWINTLSRNRDAVTRKFLWSRCGGEGVSEVRVINNCVDPDGNSVDPIVWTLDCESGEMSEPEIELGRGGS
jgi:hypothetical protein